jgi:thiol-disulfide isomerase/thioredoxin
MSKNIKKEKFFSILSKVGAIFIVALIIGYMTSLNTRGDVIVNKVEVPVEFANEFSRIHMPNRSQSLPDISFLDPAGEELFWQDFEKEYLLINFWATWCAPCVVELPSLQKLKERYENKGLQVIAISLDKQRSHADIRNFLRNRGIDNFAAHFDQSGMMERQLRLRGIPTSYLLDPQGNIITIFEGDAEWHSIPSIQYFNAVLSIN